MASASSKCPQVRILELDTDKYREEYLAEYGDPVALIASWPVQAQPLNIIKAASHALGDVKDLVLGEAFTQSPHIIATTSSYRLRVVIRRRCTGTFQVYSWT
jgi:hypothetical protein